MFKIIKTSTYKELLLNISLLEENKILLNKKIVLLDAIIVHKEQIIKNLETKLHHQTAKKLPIKKSKNK